MKFDVLLVEGGRNKHSLASVGIESVLSEKLKVGRIWLDEHGWWWQVGGENYRRVVLVGDRLIEIDQTEMLIGGGYELGCGLGKIWPLFAEAKAKVVSVKSALELMNVQMIGTGSVLTLVSHEKDMAKMVFGEDKIDTRKEKKVTSVDWNKNYLNIEEEIGKFYKFPLEIEYQNKHDKVSILEGFSNIVFRIFEDKVEEIRIVESTGLADKYVISFIGRRNFLPSKLLKISKSDLVAGVDHNLERELQNSIIDYTKKYDFRDYALFYVNCYPNGWKFDKIDLNPDLSVDGTMAKIWGNSGFSYSQMIWKIFNND